jgi:hypothetical protein
MVTKITQDLGSICHGPREKWGFGSSLLIIKSPMSWMNLNLQCG